MNTLVVDLPRIFHEHLIVVPGPERRCNLVIFFVDIWNLPVSLRSFIQNIHVDISPGYHLLLSSILFLQRLELLGHLWLHAVVFLPAAVIRLIGNI